MVMQMQSDPTPTNGLAPALNPLGLHRVYGVLFEIIKGGKETSIHFEAALSCDQKLADYYYIYQLNRGPLYINNSMPEMLIDQLNASCGQVIYPLQVITGPMGDFKGVNNKKEILQRWIDVKPELERYYKGALPMSVIAEMDKALNDNSRLLNSILSDQFIAVYFSDAYELSRRWGAGETRRGIPVLPFTRAQDYRLDYQTDFSPTDNGTFRVQFSGTYVDDRSAEDLHKKRPVAVADALSGTATPVTGAANLNYDFYSADGTIASVTGSYHLRLMDELHEVRLQIYHLKEKDKASNDNSQNVEKDGQNTEGGRLHDVGRQLKDTGVTNLRQGAESRLMETETVQNSKKGFFSFLNF
ncbi:hypothetical protein PBAL39_00832 [Pedobacter sp. BAL39]|nr:hypothetical protein PBAL39_00832 [Pedobacter sp. BAL39]